MGLPGEVEDDRDGTGSGGTGWGSHDHGNFQPAFGRGQRDPADDAIAHVDVDAALRTLAPEHRVALVLRDVADLTYDEIALILDVPIGTVRSRIARGRAALADLMTGDGPSDGPEGLEAGNPSDLPDVEQRKRTEDRTP